jgi:hypothetical protein
VTDGAGIPLVFCITGANRHDSVVFEELKLRVRFERSIQTHLALLSLACSVICVRSLPQFC